MEESATPKSSSLRVGLQWFFCAPVALLATLNLAFASQLSAPGAPVALYWCAEAALVVAAIALSPPIFFRLPKGVRKSAAFWSVAAVIFMFVTFSQVSEAYEKTPAGAKQKAERERDEAATALAEEKASAEAQEAEQFSKSEVWESDLNKAAANCLSWRGVIPDLTEKVLQKMHNPDSFDHIETKIVSVPIGGAEMHFRGENEYGAVRKFTAIGILKEGTNCEFILMGPLEDE